MRGATLLLMIAITLFVAAMTPIQARVREEMAKRDEPLPTLSPPEETTRPTPDATPPETPSPEPSAAPSGPVAGAQPSDSPTPSPAPTPTPEPTQAAPSPSPSSTAPATVAPTASASPSSTPTPTPTLSPVMLPTPRPSPSPTPKPTGYPGGTANETPNPAQQFGFLAGVVTDEQGAPISGVCVYVGPPAGCPQSYSKRTAQDGAYGMNLPGHEWEVTFDHPAYRVVTMRVEVTSGKPPATLNATLRSR